MARVYVDVDMDEFDLDDLLSEIEYRHGRRDEKEIKEFMESLLDINDEQFGMANQMKIDFLKENINEIQLTDLENLIK
jgi:hypothetical protein